MRTQIEVDNETAKELAGSGDAVLKALERDLEADVFLRGNVVTLDGSEEAVQAAEQVVREMADLVHSGHQLSEGTISAVTGALAAHESPARVLEDVVWRHRSMKVGCSSFRNDSWRVRSRWPTSRASIRPETTGS